jgi:hypothetical protein
MNKSYNREQLLSVLEKQGHSVAHIASFANAIEVPPSLLLEEFVCFS